MFSKSPSSIMLGFDDVFFVYRSCPKHHGPITRGCQKTSISQRCDRIEDEKMLIKGIMDTGGRRRDHEGFLQHGDSLGRLGGSLHLPKKGCL